MITDNFFNDLDSWSNEMPTVSNETAYMLYDFAYQLLGWIKKQYSAQALAYVNELMATPDELNLPSVLTDEMHN